MPECLPYTETEIKGMLKSKAFWIGHHLRNQCFYSMEFGTGGRINEIQKLCRSAVLDQLGRRRDIIYFTNTKNGKTMKIDLVNPVTIFYLDKWLIQMEAEGYTRYRGPLFPSPTNSQKPISIRQLQYIYTAAHLELKLVGHHGSHSCRKTWVKQTWQYYESRRVAGESIDPFMMLYASGRWETYEAMTKYCAFLKGDTKDSQEAIYPELQEFIRQEKMTS